MTLAYVGKNGRQFLREFGAQLGFFAQKPKEHFAERVDCLVEVEDARTHHAAAAEGEKFAGEIGRPLGTCAAAAPCMGTASVASRRNTVANRPRRRPMGTGDMSTSDIAGGSRRSGAMD